MHAEEKHHNKWPLEIVRFTSWTSWRRGWEEDMWRWCYLSWWFVLHPFSAMCPVALWWGHHDQVIPYPKSHMALMKSWGLQGSPKTVKGVLPIPCRLQWPVDPGFGVVHQLRLFIISPPSLHCLRYLLQRCGVLSSTTDQSLTVLPLFPVYVCAIGFLKWLCLQSTLARKDCFPSICLLLSVGLESTF